VCAFDSRAGRVLDFELLGLLVPAGSLEHDGQPMCLWMPIANGVDMLLLALPALADVEHNANRAPSPLVPLGRILM
jgi:hypothetical protein